jgi:hypothetical protein
MATKLEVMKFSPTRLKKTKRAFTTRRVPVRDMQTLVNGEIAPASGNLVLATVQELGKHRKIESVHGRRALMMPGDEILVCYGNRYAPDQYEAIIGEDLGPCDLVAGGGVAARELCRHDRMLPATRIIPIGLVANADGRPLNVFDYRIDYGEPNPTKANLGDMRVIVVAGTAMNSGKTFTAASLIRGFKQSGFRVAGIKSTGTGSGNDLWTMKDMGADVVMDFTDAGFTSTYKIPDEKIEAAVLALIYQASLRKCDYAVVEIADGLQHLETATLLRSHRLRSIVYKAVFAAYDSLGARAGYYEMLELGYKVAAVSGQLTRSPLAMREAAMSVRCPMFTPFEIQAGALIPQMTSDVEQTTQQPQPEKFAEMIKERVAKLPIPDNGMLPRTTDSMQTRYINGVYNFDYPDDP